MHALQVTDPRVIGGFRLVGVIGAGGMGTVYLAVAPDGRLAAVKQVLPSETDEPTFGARFAREIEASRRVSGAYTAAVMDADPHAATPWLASVFVPGPSLRDAVLAHGPLPEESLWRLAAGLTTALGEIHRVGLLHRDLKPGNVLLVDDGPRVIDFGIAQPAGDLSRLTATGGLIGSPGYMSPEQIEGRPLTPASDVFALGAVLAFAASGTSPFGSGSVPALLYRVMTAEPDLRDVPPRIAPLVAACLAKHSAMRPTPAQILRGLGPLPPDVEWLPAPVHHMIAQQAAAARHLAGARTPRPVLVGAPARSDETLAPDVPSSPPPSPRPPRRRWPACLAAIVVAATVAAVLAWYPRTAPRPAEVPVSPVDKAATVVADLIPRTPPGGFALYDDPQTPELDGAATDPRHINRTGTYFACDVRSDPPSASEAGMLAVSTVAFQESVETLPARIRDERTVTVAYFDGASRTQIGREVRARIGGCRLNVPTGFTRFDYSDNSVPGADETVGYTFALPPVAGLPRTPPEVGSCEIARVDAVVVRACALISNNLDPANPQNGALRLIDRNTLEPLLQRARALQAA